MAKEVLERWMPSDLGELIEALQEIRAHAAAEGHDSSTVYVNVRDLALVQQTLTDGSKAMDLVVRENR